MAYKRIAVKRVAGALGAEIDGVDLSRPLDNATFDDIHQAFLDHQVIFFRDQQLTPESHKTFARRFGTLNIHPYVAGMADHPEVMEIIKEPHERVNFGGGWHTDMSFEALPALGTLLHAIEVPAFGGDTLFASQYAAYDALTPGMKRLLESLEAVHSASREYGATGISAQARESMSIRVAEGEVPESVHPVVRTHPQTGRKALFVNAAFTVRFKDMSVRESRPLLDFLVRHATEDAFTCRFRWTAGALAFWDNRCVQHYALNDYHGQRRHMRRVTVDGDRPF